MAVYRQPADHFSPGQYLIADSAYALSSTCIPAYKVPAANDHFNSFFNTCLAKSRVRNEHCIGILKGRWGSLQQLRNQIRSAREMVYLCEWVVACFILHNMLAQLGDAWDELYEQNEIGVDEPLYDMADNNAQAFRDRVKRSALEYHGINY
jgi:hypothetical protein